MKEGRDCAFVLAEVETAASSGENPFPSSKGGQDTRLCMSVHVLHPQGGLVHFPTRSTVREQNKVCTITGKWIIQSQKYGLAICESH